MSAVCNPNRHQTKCRHEYSHSTEKVPSASMTMVKDYTTGAFNLSLEASLGKSPDVEDFLFWFVKVVDQFVRQHPDEDGAQQGLPSSTVSREQREDGMRGAIVRLERENERLKAELESAEAEREEEKREREREKERADKAERELEDLKLLHQSKEETGNLQGENARLKGFVSEMMTKGGEVMAKQEPGLVKEENIEESDDKMMEIQQNQPRKSPPKSPLVCASWANLSAPQPLPTSS